MQNYLKIDNHVLMISPLSGVTFTGKRPKISKLTSIAEFKHCGNEYGVATEKFKPTGIVPLPSETWNYLTNNLHTIIQNLDKYNGISNPHYNQEDFDALHEFGTQEDWNQFHKDAQFHCLIFKNNETKEWFAALTNGNAYIKEVAFPENTIFGVHPKFMKVEEPYLEITPRHLANEKCYVNITPEEKKFYGKDKTDFYNEPTFFNKTSRSFKKAEAALREAFNAETTMNDCERILNANGIRTHYYCAMD